jgi:DUF1365 family protein
MTFTSKIFGATTTHARLGHSQNTFSYGVDFVLIDPLETSFPRLFNRNGNGFLSVSDKDHGGEIGNGQGADWAKSVFENHGLAPEGVKVLLLTQPRIFGFGFNPVSFWMAIRSEKLIAVIAEVNNTFGDRHCYFCALPDFSEIGKSDTIRVKKTLHVSPFQDVAGDYSFRFSYSGDHLAIRIRHDNSSEGVIATLVGDFRPMTNFSILSLLARRPLGPIRTKALIHWQALVLLSKRVQYRSRPNPPTDEVSS